MARKKTKEVKEIHLNRNYETPIFEKIFIKYRTGC